MPPLRRMKRGAAASFLICISGLGLAGCHDGLRTKPWHASPASDVRGSTLYPVVDWSVVQQLSPGMTGEQAAALIGGLQWHSHPANAILYSRRGGRDYEVALRLSDDKRTITDISYKPRK
jgi:hypothetical protein